MTRARRRLVPSVLGLALVVGLAACGSDGDSTSHMSGRHDRSDMMDGGSMGNGSMGGSMMGGHGAASEVPAGARTVAVTATSFAFEPTTITVRAGEPIAIALTAEDVLHDLTAPKLDLHVAAKKGTTAKGGFTAPTTPGSYTFFCSVPGHRGAGMEGRIVVTGA